jgi:hypothetical protein
MCFFMCLFPFIIFSPDFQAKMEKNLLNFRQNSETLIQAFSLDCIACCYSGDALIWS